MNYRNAKYINTAGWVDCEIQHPSYGWIPYTLNPSDSDTITDNTALLSAMRAGGNVAAYAPPPPAAEQEVRASQARGDRRVLLTDSDWTQVADAPVNKTAWAAYRQELRDITEQAGFPININWPTKPE